MKEIVHIGAEFSLRHAVFRHIQQFGRQTAVFTGIFLSLKKNCFDLQSNINVSVKCTKKLMLDLKVIPIFYRCQSIVLLNLNEKSILEIFFFLYSQEIQNQRRI